MGALVCQIGLVDRGIKVWIMDSLFRFVKLAVILSNTRQHIKTVIMHITDQYENRITWVEEAT